MKYVKELSLIGLFLVVSGSLIMKKKEPLDAMIGAPLLHGTWASGCYITSHAPISTSRMDIAKFEDEKLILIHQFFPDGDCQQKEVAMNMHEHANIRMLDGDHFEARTYSEIMDIKFPESAEFMNLQGVYGKTDWQVGATQTIGLKENPRKDAVIKVFARLNGDKLLLDTTEFRRLQQ